MYAKARGQGRQGGPLMACLKCGGSGNILGPSIPDARTPYFNRPGAIWPCPDCSRPAELSRTPEPEPGQAWLMNSKLRGDGGDPELTRAERNALGDEAMKAAQKPAMSREEAKEFLKGVVERVRSRGLRPDPRLAELERENVRLVALLLPSYPKFTQAKLEELLAAAREAADLIEQEYGCGQSKTEKRLRAVVAAFEEGKCPHCEAGVPMSAHEGFHWTGNSNPPKCEAK